MAKTKTKAHKYVWRKKVNGKWRYYYDTDGKPDKGFSLQTISSKTRIDTSNKSDSDGMKNGTRGDTRYTLRNSFGGAIGGRTDHQSWEHAKTGTHLYYNNELVSDIMKRSLSNVKKYYAYAIDKGKSFVRKLFA